MNFEEAIDIINQKGVTAYEIHKSTGLNQGGLIRVLAREVQRPQRKTKEAIIEYASKVSCSSVVDVKLNIKAVQNAVLMFEEEILKDAIFKQWLDNKLLIKENEILRKNNK